MNTQSIDKGKSIWKYSDGMTFGQFLYANYGFSYTRDQIRKAMGDYTKLSLTSKINNNEQAR